MRTETKTINVHYADEGKVFLIPNGTDEQGNTTYKPANKTLPKINDFIEVTLQDAIELYNCDADEVEEYGTHRVDITYEEAKKVYDEVQQLGGFTYEDMPSDKVGSIFHITYLNGVEIKREYVIDATAQGTTADNAIEFTIGINCKPNTFYSYMGMTYVYMGEEKIANDWFDVRTDMELWEYLN